MEADCADGRFAGTLTVTSIECSPVPRRSQAESGPPHPRPPGRAYARFAPPRDDKVIASWNGWAIDSLLSAALIFGERAWVDLARDAAEYLWATHRTPAGLVRSLSLIHI